MGGKAGDLTRRTLRSYGFVLATGSNSSIPPSAALRLLAGTDLVPTRNSVRTGPRGCLAALCEFAFHSARLERSSEALSRTSPGRWGPKWIPASWALCAAQRSSMFPMVAGPPVAYGTTW